MLIFRGKAFQAEGMRNTGTLKREYAWRCREIAWRPARPEQRTKERVVLRNEVRGNRGARS